VSFNNGASSDSCDKQPVISNEAYIVKTKIDHFTLATDVLGEVGIISAAFVCLSLCLSVRAKTENY